jgi:hypothetical protein
MPRAAYSHGRKAALVKLGMLPRALGGAALSAGAGYLLAPDERQGQGAILGAWWFGQRPWAKDRTGNA